MGPDAAGVAYLQFLFSRVIFIFVGLGFIAVVVMLFVGGIKYLTSGGDQKGIQSANNTITWALLGILFAAVAWLILLLVQSFTGVNLIQFCIGFRPFCP